MLACRVVNCFSCLEFVYSDKSNRQEFYDKLTTMPTSETIFLLTTFANMARSRPSAEMNFIEMVSGEIFEVCTLFIGYM